MIGTKDIRKGNIVKLKNGFRAEVLDNNTRGQTRMCKVYGVHTEMGSVYATDIVMVVADDCAWTQVVLTPAQAKLVKERELWGF